MDTETQVIAMVAGLVVPLLVGALAKVQASSKLKAILNFGLTALAGVLATVVPGELAVQPFLVAWLSAWVVSVATHYGLYKPTGTTAAVAQATAGVGIGASAPSK